MTVARTFIVDADGTRFIPETKVTDRRRRIFLIICGILAAPFILAAMTGIVLAIIEGPTATPTLRDGDTISIPTNCWTTSTNEADVLIIRCD